MKKQEQLFKVANLDKETLQFIHTFWDSIMEQVGENKGSVKILPDDDFTQPTLDVFITKRGRYLTIDFDMGE